LADPALGLRFEVTIDGVDIGSFTACEGLGAEYEVFEYQEGGQNGYVHRLPGRLKYSNIKLTRPVDESSGRLAGWFSGLQRSVERCTASITALDSRGSRIAQWNIVGLYPARWTGPTFSADGASVAKESLELSHNGFLE
jgi:phage tail-like protein